MPGRMALLAVLGILLPAARLPAEERPLHERIDQLIVAATPDDKDIAAPVASDAEFLRRVTLDLTGTIPSVEEARAFLADEDPGKRAALIDRLLDSPQYARHMQRTFDTIFMRRRPEKYVKDVAWEEFLRASFAMNKPYDHLVREILGADGSDPAQHARARFYLGRNGDPHEITRDVARIFLGADIQCAQCHDHPVIFDYEQADYYGLEAFFVRSFLFTNKKEKRTVFAEKAEGEVKFKSVFLPDSQEQTTVPVVFNGQPLEEPTFKTKEASYQVPPDKGGKVRPIPKFSRRSRLPEMLATAENRRFARTAANRLWSLMMGRGIIEPVYLDHSGNPPSHPKLLKLLTDELIAGKFNIKSFFRQIALSQTYQRSSRAEGELPDPATFAVHNLRPLSPAQFTWAVLEATGEAAVQRQALGEKLTEPALHDRLHDYEDRFVSLFAGEPGELPDGFGSTPEQALFLCNDPSIQGLLKPKAGNLVDRLSKLPADKPKAVAEELFLSVVTRPPSERERQEVTKYLEGLSGEERLAAIQEMAWALLMSSEFRFNH